MKKYFSRFCFFLAAGLVACTAFAEPVSVKTCSGNEFGLTVSSYRYEEPEIDVSISGDKFGVSHTGTMLLGNDWYVRDDMRFAYGTVDYTGSGFALGEPDWYYEVRAMLGRDIRINNFVLSPFAGFGYRYLFNDSRGYSSTGAIGYRRESNYFYVPLGITHRFEMQKNEVLATTIEFDYLLFGEQVTRLTDILGHNGFTSIADSTNRQNKGYGLRFSAMYEMDDVSFGPYLYLWEIADSEMTTQSITQNGVTEDWTGLEPKNSTSEYGIKMAIRF